MMSSCRLGLKLKKDLLRKNAKTVGRRSAKAGPEEDEISIFRVSLGTRGRGRSIEEVLLEIEGELNLI